MTIDKQMRIDLLKGFISTAIYNGEDSIEVGRDSALLLDACDQIEMDGLSGDYDREADK